MKLHRAFLCVVCGQGRKKLCTGGNRSERERDDCMRKILKVDDLNRMNDVFAKYIFANEARKQLPHLVNVQPSDHRNSVPQDMISL